MRTLIIISLALCLAGCATAPRRAASGAPCDSYEYDVVRVATASGVVQQAATLTARHTVRKGETLWSISKQYGVEVDELARVNDIRDTGAIEKGQTLIIPGARTPRQTTALNKGRTNYVPARRDSFIWPVRGVIVSRFGSKVDTGLNKGIDIKASRGASVLASRDGKVVFCDTQFKGFGQTVILDHMDGYQTVYSYNETIVVNVGDTVQQGSVLAKVGSSGRATEPMLHFEIRRNGETQNPEYFLAR